MRSYQNIDNKIASNQALKAVKFIIRQGFSVVAILTGIYLIFHIDPSTDRYKFYAACLGTIGFTSLLTIAFYLHFFVKKRNIDLSKNKSKL